MENQYTYLYKDHKNQKYSSENDYDATADVDISKCKNWKETIKAFIDKGVPFIIADKTAFYGDIIAIDIESDENYVSFICKYSTNPYTNEIPTFGNELSRTGLIEKKIHYDHLVKLLQVNPSVDGKMMDELSEKYPGYLEFLEQKNNKVEGVDLRFITAPRVHG